MSNRDELIEVLRHLATWAETEAKGVALNRIVDELVKSGKQIKKLRRDVEELRAENKTLKGLSLLEQDTSHTLMDQRCSNVIPHWAHQWVHCTEHHCVGLSEAIISGFTPQLCLRVVAHHPHDWWKNGATHPTPCPGRVLPSIENSYDFRI